METKIMKISVIVPAWNAEVFIGRTLESIVAQTYQPYEILVVDDCSNDTTSDIIKTFMVRHSTIKYIKLNSNSGPARARNEGIRNVSADVDFIAFCDSDDTWYPYKLADQIDVFATSEEQNLGVVYCANDTIFDDDTTENAVTKPSLKGMVHDSVAAGQAIHGSMSSIVLTKQALDEVGYFDEDIEFDEDLEFLFQLSQKFSFDYVSSVSVSLRQHANNRSKEFKTLLTSKSYLINKHSDYYSKHKRFIKKIRLDILKNIWVTNPYNSRLMRILSYTYVVSREFDLYRNYFDSDAEKLIFFRNKHYIYIWINKYVYKRIFRLFS